MVRALRQVASPLSWYDRKVGKQDATPEIFGDVVLARKDTPTSYHLSVTHDDHLQGINLVTRGEDLFLQATCIACYRNCWGMMFLNIIIMACLRARMANGLPSATNQKHCDPCVTRV